MEGKVGLCGFQKHFYVDIYGINKSKFYINIKEAFAMHFAILLDYERDLFHFIHMDDLLFFFFILILILNWGLKIANPIIISYKQMRFY